MSKWVVHCKKQRHDVYVGRPSPYGNPFKEGTDGTRAEVIRLFEDWLLRQPELLEDVRTNLRGKILGCWCAPLPCHADVLARIANEDDEDRDR
jgi:hypothetical protein